MQYSRVQARFSNARTWLFPDFKLKVTTRSGYPSDVISPKYKWPGISALTYISEVASVNDARFIRVAVPKSLVNLSGGTNISFIKLIALCVLAQTFLIPIKLRPI